MRLYRDVTCLPGQAAHTDDFVLPESFRKGATGKMWNPTGFEELTGEFVKWPTGEPRSVPGSYYYLDTEIFGHFGHAVTEQISHLWGWEEARSASPELRCLLLRPPGRDIAPWLWDLLAAAGASADDVLVAAGPVRVDRLVATTAAYTINHSVHPIMETTYRRIGASLAQQASRQDWPDRVFFTRRLAKRGCNNRDDVENLFEQHGFQVLSPEDHSLADQIEFARRASVIAGFAGSGMFHIGFTGEPKHVIVIMSDAYHSANEYQLSALIGHRLDLVVCEPDVPRTGQGFSGEAYRSTFTVNFEREGRFLGRVLASLDGRRLGN